MINPFVSIIDEKQQADTKEESIKQNPFVPLIDSQQQDQSVAYRAAMQEARTVNPDAYAKEVSLSKRTGLPTELIARNPAKVEAQAPQISGEDDALLQTSPSTAKFLAQSDNAKYSSDDLPHLTVMEQIAKMSDQRGFVDTMGRSFLSGLNQVNTNILQTPGVYLNFLKATAAPYLSSDLVKQGFNNPLADYYKRAADSYSTEELSQDPIQLMSEGNAPQAARAIAAQVVANLPQQLYLIGATLSGHPELGLGAIAGLQTSQATDQALDNGKSPLMATLDGITQGAIEAVTEQFGTVGIVKHWETALIKSFGKTTARKLIVDVGKSIASAFLGEGSEEFIAQIGQDFSDYATGNSQAYDGRNVTGVRDNGTLIESTRSGGFMSEMQRALNAFLIGGFSGGIVTAPTVLTSAVIKGQQAESDGKWWDALLGAAQESKLRKRSPEKYEEFVNTVGADNNKPSNIYVSHDVLAQFFQTPEGVPDTAALNKFLDEMDAKDQLAEAADSGKEFEISAAKFAAKYAGSDLSQAIRGNIRFAPDGMTMNEQQKVQEDYQKMVLELQQQHAELVDTQQIPQQLQAIRDKLILPKEAGGAGIAAEDADAQVAAALAGAQRLSKQAGETVDQWFARVNPVLNVGGQVVQGPDVLNQEDPKNLIAMHNLSAENLLHADKMGGLAVPSLSIGKDTHPLTGFGEISLVGSKSLIDPARASNKVFNADVYSPRYPSVQYVLSVPSDKFKSAGDALGTSLVRELDSGSIEYRGFDDFTRLPTVQLSYLQEKGVPFEVPVKKPKTPTLNLNPELKKFIDYHSAFGEEEAKKPGFLAAYEKARLKEKSVFIKNTLKEAGSAEEAEKIYDDLFKGVWYDEEDGSPSNRVIRTMAEEARALAEKGKPDYYAAGNMLTDLIRKNYSEDFTAWARQQFDSIVKSERIPDGETAAGNRRFLPHNLENVVRVMKRKTRDGEGFNYGVGSVRSVVAKKFRTVSEIQKSRDSIVTSEEMQKLKDEVDKEFFDVMDQFTPHLEHFDPSRFGNADMFSEHLKEMATRGVKAVMDDYYGGYIPAEVLKVGNDFLDKLRNMPTEYFEAKIQRAVSLSEFSAALVPDNVSNATLDVLKKNGIKTVVKYNRDNGNSDKRNEALSELRKVMPDLFFQEARGSVQFTPSATIINLYKSANLSTFLHEMGHVFMRDMQAIVEAGKGDEQFIQDFNTLVKFVGGDIKTVEAQEKLARAFESYLREGNAPSVKLLDAFRRFRDWLTAIYRSVAGLNVEINDDIRAIFDRLLASENEIEEAKQFFRAKKSIVDLVETTDVQKAKVKAAKVLSEQEALDKAVKDRLGIYLRVQGGKQAVRTQAAKEIDAQPLYVAIKSAIERGGMDLDVIRAQYGPEKVDAIRANHPNVLRQKEKAKKPKTYFAEVLARGGIDPSTMGDLERKVFKENGLWGLFRVGGVGLDDIAASLIDEGLLTVPNDKNPGDHLKGLLEQKKSLPNFDAFVPEDAVTAAELAAEHGFPSEGELIKAMAESPRRSKAITLRANEILKQKEQDLLNDLKAQERVPGEEALHNDKSLTYLITEAEILADKVARAENRRPDVIEERVYREAANEVIGKKTVRQATRYDLYARAEQRFAKQAEDALLSGDFVAALAFKKKQLLNHAMVQAAIRARDARNKIENFFKVKNYKSKLGNTEHDFAEAAAELSAFYGLAPILPTTQDALNKVKNVDEFLYASIPDWIIEKQKPLKFEDYRDLSYTRFNELNETIRAILQYGSNEMKAAEANEAQTLQEWVTASVDTMNQLKDRDMTRRDESSRLSKPLESIDEFTAGASLVQFTSDWMDNFSFLKTGNAGPFKRLYNKVLKAEVKYVELRTDVIKDAKAAWETLSKASQRIVKENGKQMEIKGVPLSEDMRRTKRAYWSVNRMIALILNTGNAGNLSALQRAYGYSDAQIQKVAAYFTEKELQAIQTIWDATNLLFPQLDETHFSIYNRHLPKVEAQPITFTSADGKAVALKGGYYPLVFDHKINDKAEKFAEDDLMKNQTQAVIRSSKPSDGMTFSRVPGHALPPLLETYVWFTHINATARYISHARILRDLNRLTRDPEWSKTFKLKAGDEHYKNIRGWLQYNANPSRRLLTSRLDLAADWMKSLSTAAVLGFKTAVGLKQRVAVISAAQAMGRDRIANGWKWILSAYREIDFRTSVLGLSQSSTWEDMLKNSQYLKTRDGNIDRELSDMRRGIEPLEKKYKIMGKEFTARDIQDFAFEWIKMNDRATVAVVWTGAYNQYVHEKADPKATPAEVKQAAIEYADGIVQDTQASSLTPELSTIQRKEGWLRLFTSFMTSSMNYGNRVLQNYRAWNSGAISNKEFFNHVAQEYIAMPYAAYIISEALRSGGQPPDWWEWALVPFDALASWIPLLRDVFGYFEYGRNVGETPVLQPIAKTAKAVKSTAQWIFGGKEFTAALWDVGRAFEIYTKVPALNFVKEVSGVFEKLTD